MYNRFGALAFASAVLAASLVTAGTASAQSRWKTVGKTTSGNTVFVDSRSIKRHGDIVDAVVRVTFTKPIAMDGGHVAMERSNAMFNCKARTTATRDNVLYSEAAGKHVVKRTVNKLPGFGSPFKGTPPDLVLTYVCNGAGAGKPR
jgi:hypothetical protein